MLCPKLRAFAVPGICEAQLFDGIYAEVHICMPCVCRLLASICRLLLEIIITVIIRVTVGYVSDDALPTVWRGLA